MKTSEAIIELVDKFKMGNSSKYGDIYTMTYKHLYVCVLHLVKDSDIAHKILKDTYRYIYTNIDSLNNSCDFMRWASKIASKKCYEYLDLDKEISSCNKSSDADSDHIHIQNIADTAALFPVNILDNSDKVNIISNAINNLSDIQRACVIGTYYSKQSHSELSEELGISVDSVESCLDIAKSAIKASLGRVRKKKATKLLPVTPFMSLFFVKEAETCTADIVVPRFELEDKEPSPASVLIEKIKKFLSSSSLNPKMIVGTIAGIAVIVVIVLLITTNVNKTPENTSVDEGNSKAENDVETMVEENHINANISLNDLLNTTHIYDKPFTDASVEWIHEQLDNKFDDFVNTQPNLEYTCNYYLDNDEVIELSKNDPQPSDAVCSEIEVQDKSDFWKYARKFTYLSGNTDNSDLIRNNYETQYDVVNGEDQWIVSGAYKENLELSDEKEYECVILQDNTTYFEWDKYDDEQKNEKVFIRYNVLDNLPKDQIQNSILGQNIEEYLNSLYAGLYDLSLKYDTVYFDNGRILHDNNDMWCIEFDESPSEQSNIRQIILRSNHDNQPYLNDGDIYIIQYASEDVYTQINEAIGQE